MSRALGDVMTKCMERPSNTTHNSFIHDMHVAAHDLRITFDAINHSGGAPFIYPMFGLLIVVLILAIRHHGRGGGGDDYRYPHPTNHENYSGTPPPRHFGPYSN